MASIRQRRTVRSSATAGARVCAALLATASLVSGALAADGGKDNRPVRLGVYQRPSIKDLKTIEQVASEGIAQNVPFKTGARIARFVGKKCGLPAATLEIHPEYERLLLQSNIKAELTHEDLLHLRRDTVVEVPACAAFSDFIGAAVVPREGGIAKLAGDLSLSFDPAMFAGVIGRQDVRAKLNAAVSLALTKSSVDEFAGLSDQLCKDKKSNLSALLACQVSLTIAGANPEMRDQPAAGAKIFIPVAGLSRQAAAQLDQLPVRPEVGRIVLTDVPGAGAEKPSPFDCAADDFKPLCNYETRVKKEDHTLASVLKDLPGTMTLARGGGGGGFFNSMSQDGGGGFTTSFNPAETVSKPTARKAIVFGLRFVVDVDDASQYDACANAETLNKGKWPFDVDEFKRAAKLSDIEHNSQSGKILIADTGFDFSGDAGPDPIILATTKNIFLRKLFHAFDVKEDPDDADDKNQDGAFGNGGWAGVNLATPRGERSAQSIVNSDYRGHGLAVTALALGGRQLAALRQSNKLKFEIGEINLVPKYNDTNYISSGFIDKTVVFAKSRLNLFDVVNLSLASEEDEIWRRLATDVEKRQLTFVVAAGNDHKPVNSSSKDGVWPAALGGASLADSPLTTSFITVGAHDGNRQWAGFSNYGPGVDILAPGCAVPTYALKLDNLGNLAGITETSLTGTSVAAPLVSFAAGLLAGNSAFQGKPAAIKVRIQIGSDYDVGLQSRTISSGVFNIAKVLGFKYDIIEVAAGQDSKARKLRYGTTKLATADGLFKCDLGPPIALGSIKKLARGKDVGDALLVLATDDPTKATKLTPHFCSPSALSALKIDFTDTETNQTESIDPGKFRDYIARSIMAP